MIELISESRCIQCNKCVKICPTNVFDEVSEGAPTLTRQSDCQTCFLCEAYCPVDAIYVGADAYQVVGAKEEDVVAKGLLGKFRKTIGWTPAYTIVDKKQEQRELYKQLNIGPGKSIRDKWREVEEASRLLKEKQVQA